MRWEGKQDSKEGAMILPDGTRIPLSSFLEFRAISNVMKESYEAGVKAAFQRIRHNMSHALSEDAEWEVMAWK